MSNHQQPSRGPDYGIAKILRGFAGFEDYYQGLSRGIPIALSPYESKTVGRERNAAANYGALSSALSKQTLDSGPVDAPGADGIHSPNLVDGVPTVLGSNCVFLFPRVQEPLSEEYQPTYKLIWRVRSLDTFAQTQLPYHANLRSFRYQDRLITTQVSLSSGQPVFSGDAAQRAVMATTEETIRFTTARATTSPLSNMGYQAANDLIVQPQPPYGSIQSFDQGEGVTRFVQGPILPFQGAFGINNITTGNRYVYADLGQNPLTGVSGIGSPTGDSLANKARVQVSHVSYSTVAKGDEVIVLVYNALAGANFEDPDPGVYNFDGGNDFNFSCLFGRGGYRNPLGLEEGARKPFFPNGSPFGVYLLQGHS